MEAVVGWDVGGAHLKGARFEAGRIVAATQVPCPLWLGLDRLEAALVQARASLGQADRHAVTTTGELADVFSSRREGVARLARLMTQCLSPGAVSLYAGPLGFVAAAAAEANASAIASANWHASAAMVARRLDHALVVDMGSTTTDIVPVVAGKVAARGYSDMSRLAEGELVYTGLTRTFVMAMAGRVPFAGRWVPLMNEYFASSADVHRILGELDEAADQHPAADGRDKTVGASMARLARMVGCDAADASDDQWTGLAAWLAEAQLRAIEDAARQVVSRGELSRRAPVVAAGVGLGVVARLAARLGRPLQSFDRLIDAVPEASAWTCRCAPAAAVAALLAQAT